MNEPSDATILASARRALADAGVEPGTVALRVLRRGEPSPLLNL